MSDINFVAVDGNEILTEMILQFESIYGETLQPGDERRLFLYQLAQVMINAYGRLNDAARQNLLRYARGEILDAIGERVNTPRLQASYATVTIRITLSVAQTTNITIPAGTRCTPDGTLYFATVDDLTIPAGQMTGDVKARATVAGLAYNGFVAGQITALVDPVPFVAGIANTDISSGGTDIEEDDDGVNVWSGYRERIRLAPAGMSTAGPSDAYIYWAKTADAEISDVAVHSPGAGQVQIVVLMNGGQHPSQTVLDKVLTVCSDKKRRPLTDSVIAVAPATVSYNITTTYYISAANSASENSIKNAVQEAVEQYKSWQCGALGRSINPDYLRQLVLNAGAYRIDVTAPVHVAVGNTEVAASGTVNLTYGGMA